MNECGLVYLRTIFASHPKSNFLFWFSTKLMLIFFSKVFSQCYFDSFDWAASDQSDIGNRTFSITFELKTDQISSKRWTHCNHFVEHWHKFTVSCLKVLRKSQWYAGLIFSSSSASGVVIRLVNHEYLHYHQNNFHGHNSAALTAHW